MNNKFFQSLYRSQKLQAIVILFVVSVMTFSPYLQFSLTGNVASATNTCQPIHVDFEEFAVGTEFVTGDVAFGATITINSNGSNDSAMIFDSLNPTGDDNDLTTRQSAPNQAYHPSNTTELGKVLIISQDGDSSDPDDESEGGKITLEYDDPINFSNISFLDVEEVGGSVKVYNGATLEGSFPIANKGDNSYQNIVINKNNIDKVVIKLAGSGAITDWNYCIPETEEPYCELSITKSDTGYDPATLGGDIVYKLRLENTGTGECEGGGVELQDKYPNTQLEYVSYQLGDNSYPFEGDQFTHSGDELTWNFGTIQKPSEDNWNGVREVDVTFKVKDAVQCEEVITNKLRSYTSSNDQNGNQINWSGYIEEDTTLEDCTDNELMSFPVKSCTGIGELFAYKNDQNQPIDATFIANADEVIIFARDNANLTVEVNSSMTPLTTVISKSFAKVYSLSVTPGDSINVAGTNNARDVQGYLVQDSNSPVFDLSTFEIVIDDAKDNDMYLPAGTYTYVFFDKYTYRDNGNDDSRQLSVEIDSSSLTVLNDSYTKPSPAPVEGIVIKDYTITQEDTYTMSVNTDDSIYWAYQTCPVLPTYCGDGIVQQPNSTGTGGPNNDGYEECDTEWMLGQYSYCSDQCTIEHLTYCGDGTVQSPNDVLTGGPNNDGYEQCDDGNDINGDGCSNQCVTETNTQCELKLTKLADKSVANLGDAIGYSLLLKNIGTEDCTNVVLTEDYPSDLTFVSSTPLTSTGNDTWDVGTLGVNESFSVEIEVEVPDNTNLCETTQTNYANYNSDQTGPGTPVDASTDIQCSTTNKCILQLEKTDANDPVRPGDDLVYTLTLTNIGDASCTNVILEEEYDSNTTFVSSDIPPLTSSGERWNVGGMVPGDVFEVVITTKVADEEQNPEICEIGSLLNTAYRDSDQTARGSVTEPTEINCSGVDVYLTKTVNDDSVRVGESVNFTITVGNEGGLPATGVVVKDVLPSGLNYISNQTSVGLFDSNLMEWSVGDLVPGQTETLDITVSVTAKDTFTNVAEVIAHNEDDIDSIPNNGTDNQEDDHDSASVTGTSGGGGTPVNPLISIIKSAGVQFTNPDTVVNYTLEITNSGRKVGHNLVVTDVLPAPLTYVSSTITGTWDLGDIGIGETKTLTYDVQFPEGTAKGNYTNIATAKISNGNSDDDDAVVEVRDTIVYGEEYDPALSIEKTIDRSFTNPGGQAVYTVVVKNVTTNNVTAKNVILTDRMPGIFTFIDNGSNVKGWNLGNLKPGEFKTVVYTIDVSNEAINGVYDNIARASADNAPEVYDIEPLEVRDVVVEGFELPDTNGVQSLYLTFLSGILMIMLGWMIWKYRQLSINEL